MKLREFFDHIYRPERLIGKSENTNRLYRLSIDSFGKTVATTPAIDHLTDRNIALHMQRVLDNGRSVATANKDRTQLVAIWRHACRTGHLDRWPTVRSLNEPERTPRAWLADEIQQLLATIDKQDGFFCNVPRSLWWRTIVLVCLDTGERITAIRQMQWHWLSGEWLTIPAEARKGNRRDRTYRLRPETIGHLEAIRLVSSKKPFPWPYCSMYLWKLFGKLLEESGLPATRRDKFHKLRRTTGSVAHAAGLDAQEVLDHQYRRTTQRYLDPRFQRSKQACDVLADFLANPDPEKKDRRSGHDRRQTG